MTNIDSPVAREFLRQATNPDLSRPHLIDMSSLYEAVGEPTFAHPLILKLGGKAIHGTDPLEGSEVIEGRIYGNSLLAGDFALNVDPALGPAYIAFTEEYNVKNSMMGPLLEAPTPTRVFFALATVIMITWHEEHEVISPPDAVKHLLACVEHWANQFGSIPAETAVARIQRVLRGEGDVRLN